MAGPAVMSTVPASNVLAVSHLNVELARMLIESGFVFGYQDVVAAAKKHVIGVEAWVLADELVSKESSVPSSIPALPAAICHLVSTSHARPIIYASMP